MIPGRDESSSAERSLPVWPDDPDVEPVRVRDGHRPVDDAVVGDAALAKVFWKFCFIVNNFVHQYL